MVGTTYLIKAACQKDNVDTTYQEFVKHAFDNEEEANVFADNLNRVMHKMHSPPVDPTKPFISNFLPNERLYMSYVCCGTWYLKNKDDRYVWVEKIEHIITSEITWYYYPFDPNKSNKSLFGKLHRTNGPAIEIADERFRKDYPFIYYLYGVPYTHKEYLDACFLLGLNHGLSVSSASSSSL